MIDMEEYFLGKITFDELFDWYIEQLNLIIREEVVNLDINY